MAQKVKKTEPSRKRSRREPGKTTISSKNQITIPVEAMRKAGFEPGTKLEVASAESGEIVLIDPSPEARARMIENFEGAFHYPENYLEDLRRVDREKSRW